HRLPAEDFGLASHYATSSVVGPSAVLPLPVSTRPRELHPRRPFASGSEVRFPATHLHSERSRAAHGRRPEFAARRLVAPAHLFHSDWIAMGVRAARRGTGPSEPGRRG